MMPMQDGVNAESSARLRGVGEIDREPLTLSCVIAREWAASNLCISFTQMHLCMLFHLCTRNSRMSARMSAYMPRMLIDAHASIACRALARKCTGSLCMQTRQQSAAKCIFCDERLSARKDVLSL